MAISANLEIMAERSREGETDMATTEARSFLMPGKIVYGEGALQQAAPSIAEMGRKALIVTDSMMVKLGNLDRLTRVLEAAGVDFSVYDGINSEPVDKMVDGGIRRFSDDSCDFMIALGGGSPIDTMKAIAMCVASGEKISSFMGKPYSGPVCPMVAIPTTAGTGSEATQFTIITDTENDIKMLIAGAPLIPALAIVDPVFTVTAPAGVTAATGVDALCHAIEAYTSRKAQPMSQVFALSAAKRIFAHLATCVEEPDNIDARIQMSLAATEAGIAFNNASVTIIHGMSRPIGALFHVPHGLSNAMLMRPCLEFAAGGARGRFAELARFCGMSVADDDRVATQELLCAIDSLLIRINIPSVLEYGIDRNAFLASVEKMAFDAEASGSPANTLRNVSIEDIQEIYRSLV